MSGRGSWEDFKLQICSPLFRACADFSALAQPTPVFHFQTTEVLEFKVSCFAGQRTSVSSKRQFWH